MEPVWYRQGISIALMLISPSKSLLGWLDNLLVYIICMTDYSSNSILNYTYVNSLETNYIKIYHSQHKQIQWRVQRYCRRRSTVWWQWRWGTSWGRWGRYTLIFAYWVSNNYINILNLHNIIYKTVMAMNITWKD
jgi:hypothetical protein